MRKPVLIVAFAAAVMLLAAQASAAGPWKISCWQNGVPADSMQAGQQFQIRGEGFHNRVLPVKICISGSYCTLAVIDQKGEFIDVRTLDVPGDHTITVSQAKNPKLLEWVERASGRLTVQN